MKIKELLKSLSEVKSRYPVFDLNEFNINIDGKEPIGLGVDIQTFTVNITSTVKEAEEEVEEDADL